MDEQKVMDLFGGKLVEIEDTGVDFDKPLKGAYIARIASLKRYAGESEKCENGVYDMWSLNLQIEETLEGDKGDNRFISKTYSNTVGKYQETAEEGVIRLANDLFTAGILTQCTITKTDKMEVISEISEQIVDKLCNVRAYKTKGGKQAVKIVKEFKNLKKAEASDDTEW